RRLFVNLCKLRPSDCKLRRRVTQARWCLLLTCSKRRPVDGEGMTMVLGNSRAAEISRKTNETDIRVSVALDGSGRFEVSTGVGFFDHMLEQLSRHSLID